MKGATKTLLGQTLFASRLDEVLLRNTAVVVAFHRVLDGTDASDALSIDVRMFERFCRFFRRHFQVVTLQDLVSSLQTGRSFRSRLAITFDDGYRDNFENAAPVLEKLSLPATFFVVTRWVGTDVVPWWDSKAGMRYPWMTWEQVRSLHRKGFDIGGHTRTHADLGQIAEGEAREEILGARLELEKHLGASVKSFAYPYGGRHNLTEANRELVKAASFRCCCSGFGGVNVPGTDPFDLRRVPISPWYTTPQQFGLEVALGRTALSADLGAILSACVASSLASDLR
jgi:peptidoglycan/xylan/chitin deacetylase (PgdA/CDA1 family)